MKYENVASIALLARQAVWAAAEAIDPNPERRVKVLSLYEAGEVVGRTCPRCGRDVIMPDHGADLRHTLPPTRLDLQYGSSFGASCGACGIHYVAVPPGGPQAFRGTTAKAVTSVN